MYYVYILRCADGALYVGYSTNLEARIRARNEGLGANYACKRRPVTLVYKETHRTRTAAIRRKRQLKRWTQRKEARTDLRACLDVFAGTDSTSLGVW